MNTSKTLPLISVCIPTRNAEKYLEECLDSVVSQHYPNLEIIISDDNSEDSTLAICHSFKANSRIPMHIMQHTPSTLAENWNNCVKYSKGEFIKFVFQDDVLRADCISNMAAKIDKKYSSQFIFCNRDFILEDLLSQDEATLDWMERYKDLAHLWKFNLTNGMSGKELLKKSSNLFAYPLNKVGEPSVTLISRNIFEKHKFDPSLQQLTDVEFYYRVFSQCNINYIPENLVSVRLHTNQQTQKNIAEKNADEDLLLFYTLKQRIGKLLHPITNLFPIRYKAKKYVKKLLKMNQN